MLSVLAIDAGFRLDDIYQFCLLPSALAAGNNLQFILGFSRMSLFYLCLSYYSIINQMLMSWVRIWIHMVFATKNRHALLHSKDIRDVVFDHIKENAKEKDIWLENINGHKEHAHCLISLGRTQSVSRVAQMLKGESSIWINKTRIIQAHFNWQDDYWAVSVSESHIDSVKKYIDDQEMHHKSKSFDEEVNDFMKKYGWQIIKDAKT